jgi:AcrR family transcriptional regulator
MGGMDEKIEATGMRERILETASRQFVSRGYDGVSMREIADACGMSKAGLYYHFQDKEQLFLEILRDNLDQLQEVIESASGQPGGAREKLAFFVKAVFLTLPPDQSAIIRLANQELSKVSQPAREKFDQSYHQGFINPLVGLLGAGIRAGEFREVDPQLAVWGLLGLMYPFMSPYFAGQKDRANQVIDFVLTCFFEGVNARG